MPVPSRQNDIGNLRIGVAAIMQESNSFSPRMTDLDVFENAGIHCGEAMLALADTRTEVGGFLAKLAEAGAEPVPLLATNAPASGPCRREAFEALVSELERRVSECGPLDGVLVALHGAFVLEDSDDGDAEIVARLRAATGPDVPIAVTLDLHAHVTESILFNEVILVGYKTYPHVDIFETGAKAAELLLERIARGEPFVMALAKAPMIVTPDSARKGTPAFDQLAALARVIETHESVRDVSVYYVQPHLDVADLGFSVLICASSPDVACKQARMIADQAWSLRTSFRSEAISLEDAISRGISEVGLTVISDSGDAPSGGAAAGSTAVLKELLDAGLDISAPGQILLTLCDPVAAAKAAQLGARGIGDFRIGHEQYCRPSEAVAVNATVASVSNGTYRIAQDGPVGAFVEMGLTAVLTCGKLTILVRSYPAIEWDPEMYLSQGIDLGGACIAFVKSPSHFRASFAPFADHIHIAATPGPTSLDLKSLPYTRVTRPLFPLDNFSEPVA